MLKASEIPLKKVTWKPCYRIIPSRYPPSKIYERVSSEEDFEVLVELESLTNPRIREELGQTHLVAEKDKIFGEGVGYVMAAFTHLNPSGSRFSNGSYGVYYAAKSIETAIQETKFHREKFLSYTKEKRIVLEMRVILADLKGDLHDLRAVDESFHKIHDPNNYKYSQALGLELRKTNSFGVVYRSVRHENGECLGVFRPPIFSKIRSEQHLYYHWDGKSITNVSENKAYF